MDGPHDLGGKQGFGPVATDEPEEPFHADWEGRVWAVDKLMVSAPGVTIDWWRHGRELIEPVDYLTRPYFDQWLQNDAALLIDAGICTLEEVTSGHARTPGPDLEKPTGPGEVLAAASRKVRYDREIDRKPAFKAGDKVRTVRDGHPGHTRLPAYARDRIGTVERYCGAHLFADAGARGEERAEPLYTVVFDSGELWPEAKGRRETVSLDLWEPYLERA